MKPRAGPFAIVLALVFLAMPLAAKAQENGKVYRIGVLDVGGLASNEANLGAFRHGLRELGYVEGQNLVIEYRWAARRAASLPDLATELVRLNVDVLVTRGTSAALVAKHVTETIPIVMASSGDPVHAGLVASLARPGGNVTGLHVIGPPELAGKRLQLLKEVIPGLSRVGVLSDSGDVYSELMMREIERLAPAIGVQLHRVEARRPEERAALGSRRSRAGYFEGGFEAAILDRVDALIAVEGVLTVTDLTGIVDFAAMSRLPAIYGLREFVEAGGLMAYGTDLRDLFRRAATYVHRVLEGAKPAELPVEPPAKFELVINLKAAKALGLSIPPSLLLRADQVIE
ncbi:MAG TPA: ABC transporter substrate-binding protein [Methylomirabilota bacterium]|nr:ABC transporter substrate-binding protein [Methylomirabilota bacterium]